MLGVFGIGRTMECDAAEELGVRAGGHPEWLLPGARGERSCLDTHLGHRGLTKYPTHTLEAPCPLPPSCLRYVSVGEDVQKVSLITLD